MKEEEEEEDAEILEGRGCRIWYGTQGSAVQHRRALHLCLGLLDAFSWNLQGAIHVIFLILLLYFLVIRSCRAVIISIPPYSTWKPIDFKIWLNCDSAGVVMLLFISFYLWMKFFLWL